MNELLNEPAVWVLVGLLTCAFLTLLTAIRLRPVRRRMLVLMHEIQAEGRLTPADKAWMRTEIDRSRGYHLLLVSPFAPFAIFAAIAAGIAEGWRPSIGYENRIDEIKRDTDLLHRKGVEISEGIDPMKGRYWNDIRRQEIYELSATLETWSNPIAMLWILIWLGLAAPFLLIGYLVSGTLRPFLVNVWEPFRDPVLKLFDLARWKAA
ncbi:hypothetical protein [Aliihoeflea sp. 2WW]|jgi:hypothetical protein|uniref:hypothetical protein n=1 Tax=Aliihoeflea sp. 2WW TaxID=1381123 RepID=UPI0013788308|nr:hypothetical protein [Aliihoeflea sp. 2WW]